MSDPSAPAEVRVFGIRHHGPGSARSVRSALDDFAADVVLIEGPADADPLVALVGDSGMEPPVALLAYVDDEPRTAAFWPFAVFSPEWQALIWATRRGVPVRFCDLPAAAVLAARNAEDDAGGDELGSPEPLVDEPAAADPPLEGQPPEERIRHDPVAVLASAAGYDDPERWWDDLVESRLDDASPFAAIGDAMAELREAAPARPAAETAEEDRREAHMRIVLRGVIKEGHRKVAVVCGAWHAPALSGKLPPASADAALLKGMPKRKTTLTWVPWTHSRLAAASGYGAGITSPGWYHHLFTSPDRTVTRWFTAVAGVLRREDLPVSSAHVIEAVRLAESLATMRARPLAGLGEVTEASRAVLCDGDDVLLDLVTRQLVVGEALGAVPDDAPSVPLEADLRAQARRLRLRIDAAEKVVELDLRKETDLGRSRLLHRLRLLGVDWGVPARSTSRNLGTFREAWVLRWRPELAVDLVEASLWGTTVDGATTAKLVDAGRAATLAELTACVEGALLADLPQALPDLLRALDARAALDLDLTHLMEAFPPLVRALRYGDVRGTDTSALVHVTNALLVRICAGLPPALTGLDDESAELIRKRIDSVHEAVVVLSNDDARQRWLGRLATLADRGEVHGVVIGRIVRILLDAAELDTAGAATRLSRALSVGSLAPAKAAWVEGFLSGGGQLLVHDTNLLALLDEWVTHLDAQAFVDVLPLLRRTFGGFAPAERRAVATQIARGPGTLGRHDDVRDDIDEALATPAVHAVAELLGVAE